MKYDVITEALIAGARQKKRIDILSKEVLNRLKSEPVNLPRYAIAWQDKLTYQQFREKYNIEPLLSHQIPQCHICTRFHTDDNPLFAYSYLEKGSDYRLIYRCQSGHGHDYGMILMDIQTGLEMHL